MNVFTSKKPLKLEMRGIYGAKKVNIFSSMIEGERGGVNVMNTDSDSDSGNKFRICTSTRGNDRASKEAGSEISETLCHGSAPCSRG